MSGLKPGRYDLLYKKQRLKKRILFLCLLLSILLVMDIVFSWHLWRALSVTVFSEVSS